MDQSCVCRVPKNPKVSGVTQGFHLAKICLLALLLAATSMSWVRAGDAPVILVLGDSLSAGFGLEKLDLGWVARLQERLEQRGYPHRVVNASLSGDTTQGGRVRLPQALARNRPSVVIIELGGNDGLRGLSPAQMEANLASMVDQARAAGATPILAGVRLPPNYGPAYTQLFQKTFREVAQQQEVPLIPNLLAGVDDQPALMQADGIHPTAKAQPLLLDNVWRVLETHLKRNPEELSWLHVEALLEKSGAFRLF